MGVLRKLIRPRHHFSWRQEYGFRRRRTAVNADEPSCHIPWMENRRGERRRRVLLEELLHLFFRSGERRHSLSSPVPPLEPARLEVFQPRETKVTPDFNLFFFTEFGRSECPEVFSVLRGSYQLLRCRSGNPDASSFPLAPIKHEECGRAPVLSGSEARRLQTTKPSARPGECPVSAGC